MPAFGRVEPTSSKGLLDPPVRILSLLREFCRRLCQVERLFFVPLLQAAGSKVERFRRTAAGARKPRQWNIVQINRAQSRGPRSGNIGRSLQNIELRS